LVEIEASNNLSPGLSIALLLPLATDVNSFGWNKFSCCSFSGFWDKVAENSSFCSYKENITACFAMYITDTGIHIRVYSFLRKFNFKGTP